MLRACTSSRRCCHCRGNCPCWPSASSSFAWSPPFAAGACGGCLRRWRSSQVCSPSSSSCCSSGLACHPAEEAKGPKTSLGHLQNRIERGKFTPTPKLSGRHRGIASLVFSHRGSASQRISAARTRIARIFALHRIAISVFSTHRRSHRIVVRIARYGPLKPQDFSLTKETARFTKGQFRP